MDSSMSTKKKTKLSVRNQTCFKKSSLSSSSTAKKTTNLSMREQTMFKKALELSTLCNIDVCVIYYGRDGKLIKTWPEDQSKVRDMAERFSRLHERERCKKRTNLSLFLRKKILDDTKLSEKVLEMEDSLESGLRVLQDKLLLLQPEKNQTEFGQTRAVSSTTNPLSPPPSLIEDHRHQQWTEPLMSGVSNTEQDLSTSSLSQNQSRISVFLYNHDNRSFYQVPDSVSSFDQSALLGEQGSGLGSNFDLPPMVFPPQMQTQTPLVPFDQFAAWNQAPSFADPMMFPYN
ncbi:AGAMOUS-like 53 [Arabidopsis thaliana]|uniref:Agamous-like MADS-box protein AGL53 n=1 Tax=Arabidopsis thaliana TaxID=3702 RepID=AGL53_ARATH|nr:AGAMOUS-like 53 [Arabidopsis thaliana]Q7X9N2.1 RecName: Full=Agamous-like MADS-box protein AGL53 [Arabidopsis thaliana]AAN52781.1 MADS-box protein AGL53 [Arabidopsis thaliana]AED93646.1 AGAMOUS-like 53 [Arabidopsis thaliana]|eukprot:NP_198059.1 AGAMOUS-like 53 [Arabidopsis thaliana]